VELNSNRGKQAHLLDHAEPIHLSLPTTGEHVNRQGRLFRTRYILGCRRNRGPEITHALADEINPAAAVSIMAGFRLKAQPNGRCRDQTSYPIWYAHPRAA
jgi:hypothetical protein